MLLLCGDLDVVINVASAETVERIVSIATECGWLVILSHRLFPMDTTKNT